MNFDFCPTVPAEDGIYWIVRGNKTAIRNATARQRESTGSRDLLPTQAGEWEISLAECITDESEKRRVRVFGDRERRIDDPKLLVLLWGPKQAWPTPDGDWGKFIEQINEICEPHPHGAS